MEIQNYINNGATNKGTRVVEKGKGLDKNSFFKILAAQLMNQDPSKPADSTEFVAQLAQFTTLEEMENLNKTMSFQSASDLVGKTVAFDSYNYKGEQYGGLVKYVRETVSGPLVVADVIENNKVVEKEFKLSDVSDIYHKANPYLANMNVNLDFHSLSVLIGKEIKATGNDGVYEGAVKSVYKAKDGIRAIMNTSGRVISQKMDKKESYNNTDIFLNGVYKDNKNIEVFVKYTGEAGNEYEYMIKEEGDSGEENWNRYEADTEIRGMKILIPEENPELPCNWSFKVKSFESSEIHVPSANVLQVSE